MELERRKNDRVDQQRRIMKKNKNQALHLFGNTILCNVDKKKACVRTRDGNMYISLIVLQNDNT
jgi:hypothetical protein